MTLIKITLTDGSIIIRKGVPVHLDHFGKLIIHYADKSSETIVRVESYSTRVKPQSYVLQVRHKRIGTRLYHSPEKFAKLAAENANSRSWSKAAIWSTVPSLLAIRAALKEGLKHPDWSFEYVGVEDPKLLKMKAPKPTRIMTVCPECGGYPTDREGAEMGDGGVFEKVADCDKCTTGGKDYISASEVIEGEDYILETGKDSEVATCTQTAEIKRHGLTYHVARFGGVTVTELER
jgi:hypothetical protein